MTRFNRVLDLRDLPREVPGQRASIFAGMVLFVLIEATVIASLLTSYYYVRVLSTQSWPPPGITPPELLWPGVSLILLVISLGPALWARWLHRRGRVRRFRLAMGLGLVLLLAYLGVAFYDLFELPYDWKGHVYGSLVWTLTGYQLLHVIGLFFLALGVSLLGLRHEGLPRDAASSVVVLYWGFVVLVALPSYFTLYLVPHLF